MPTGAVFLSYASEDSEAAARIAEALKAAGIEVWFDRSELRGGDAWDRRIRDQIQNCRLFIPVISAHTQARDEGYFRREWLLAADRTRDMAHHRAFIVPVVIDGTPERGASVPEKFQEVQWTRLAGGETSSAFTERIVRLLTPAAEPRVASPPGPGTPAALAKRSGRSGLAWAATAAAVVAALGYAGLVHFRSPGAVATTASGPGSATQETPGFSPPAHSIAVLPFANLSGDPAQEYFSDGLTEELLNALADVTDLQVAARTSAFSFKGKDIDVATIARRLNVASILEGSVRRSGKRVRITAQLVNAQSGFRLWTRTFDRDLSDVLVLQTEIATAVAKSLEVTLLGDVAARIEVGGTRVPGAFDAYLRALKLARIAAEQTPMDCREPIAAFDEAVRLDPNFALAYALRAVHEMGCADNSAGWLRTPDRSAIRADIDKAISLAPGLADGYVARSRLEEDALAFTAADQACKRALELAASNASVLRRCGLLSIYFGRTDTGIAGIRRAIALDPLNEMNHRALGDALRYARQYDQAVSAYQAAISAGPEHAIESYALMGISYYLVGDLTHALTACERSLTSFRGDVCRAMVYDKLGRHADAAAAVATITANGGDAAAYQYVQIYAQWGDHARSLEWLEKAVRLHDPGLVYTRVDPLLDPLRHEPRFEAVLRSLQFPD